MEKEVNYIDDKTGEVLSSKKMLVQDWFTEEGYLFWCQKAQSRQFSGITMPNISYEAKGIFGEMCRLYLRSGDNLLEVKTKGGYRPFDLNDLEVLLGVSTKQAKRRLDLFLREKMLAILDLTIGGEKKTWYVVNPIYYIAGKRLSYTTYKLFRNELQNLLSDKTVKALESNNKGA